MYNTGITGHSTVYSGSKPKRQTEKMQILNLLIAGFKITEDLTFDTYYPVEFIFTGKID